MPDCKTVDDVWNSDVNRDPLGALGFGESLLWIGLVHADPLPLMLDQTAFGGQYITLGLS